MSITIYNDSLESLYIFRILFCTGKLEEFYGLKLPILDWIKFRRDLLGFDCRYTMDSSNKEFQCVDNVM